MLPAQTNFDQLRDRSIVARRLKPLPIEAVVRGYLIGSGWKDYLDTGQVCGIDLPAGLQQAEKLPQTLFTPASKAEAGDHDENISFEKVVEMVGENLAHRVRDISIQIYERAAEYALQRGIIIADTKFEFGLDDNNLVIEGEETNRIRSAAFSPSGEFIVTNLTNFQDDAYMKSCNSEI